LRLIEKGNEKAKERYREISEHINQSRRLLDDYPLFAKNANQDKGYRFYPGS
jgi:hypothetical protein